jgi:hypothetical protein
MNQSNQMFEYDQSIELNQFNVLENTTNRIKGMVGIALGIILGLISTDYIVRSSNVATQEFVIKPMPVISGIWEVFILFIVIIFILQIFFEYGIMTQIESSIGKILIPMILKPLLIFLFSFMATLASPYSLLSITFNRITFWIPILFAAIIAIVFFIIELVNSPFRLSLKSNTVGTVFIAWVIGWIILCAVVSI